MLAEDGRGFAFASSQRPFRPWGVNYGHDGKLMEDFWDEKWSVLEEDFSKIKRLGANVVRVHLQFGKFMKSAAAPNAQALDQFSRLLKLAERSGLYLDVTGLACYRPADVPGWYDTLDDNERWAAQAVFWRAIAGRGVHSKAVFCYNLMNEPVSPADKSDRWYSGQLLGEYDFVQRIARDPDVRTRHEIAVAWIKQLSASIREHDPQTMITVGMLPWVTGWKHLSGFVPRDIAPHVDFLSVHLYPKSSDPEEARTALRECDVGKPVVIEETFPLHCSAKELETFLLESQSVACGWLFHYDGMAPDEYDALEQRGELTLAQGIWRAGLRLMISLRPTLLIEKQP